MNKKNILMLTLSFGLYLTACNNSSQNTDAEKQANTENKQTNAIDNDDSKFMTDVASGGMMEVAAGKIALNRSNNDKVREFAQRMVTDHSRLDSQLTALAGQKNVVLPTVLSDADQKNIDKLNAADAKDFDKTYMDMMVDGHEDAVSKFQDKINNPKDADLKAWAQQTLPILQQHLEMAKTDQEIVDKAHKNS